MGTASGTRAARVAACLLLALAALRTSTAAPKKLLVVTATKGFRHDSIPTAERLIAELGEAGGACTVAYARTDQELGTKMTARGLEDYEGVVFASTTGELPLPDRQGFVDWIRNGHAFVGLHAASDTLHGYAPFLELIGAEFKTHGPQVKVSLIVEDPSHPATKDLANPTEVFDEIYQFTGYDPARVHNLLSLDRHPNDGTPGYCPLAWTRTPGKGRVFYTALGHREDVLEAPWFKRHLTGGIAWALGLSN